VCWRIAYRTGGFEASEYPGSYIYALGGNEEAARLSGVDSFWQYIATGLVIVLAAYVEVAQHKITEASLSKIRHT
jgi:predicted ABC-type sugar transport system permease subunit